MCSVEATVVLIQGICCHTALIGQIACFDSLIHFLLQSRLGGGDLSTTSIKMLRLNSQKLPEWREMSINIGCWERAAPEL